jgi:hypothetical protein
MLAVLVLDTLQPSLEPVQVRNETRPNGLDTIDDREDFVLADVHINPYPPE